MVRSPGSRRKETLMSLVSVSRRDWLRAAGMTALATALPALTTRNAHAADDIKIGALCELSGPASTLGSQQILGIKMAVDDINKAGGIMGGRKIALIVEDTESKVATGLAKAKKLVERDGVH